MLSLCRSLIKLDLSSTVVTSKHSIEVGREKGERTEHFPDAQVGDVVMHEGLRSVVTTVGWDSGKGGHKPYCHLRRLQAIPAICNALNGNGTIQELIVADIRSFHASRDDLMTFAVTTLRTMT